MDQNLSEQAEYDVFVSHATEDKESFVRELVGKLSDLGLNVWYDEFALDVGDSLSSSIDRGLSKSRYGIVVLSQSFLKKAWPEYELRGMLSRQIGGRMVILPIWHGITEEDLLEYSPTLAQTKALNSQLGINVIGLQLLKVVKPLSYRRLQAMKKLGELLSEGEIRYLNSSEIKMDAPRLRDRLTDSQLIRLRIVKALLGPLDRLSFEESYDCYLRDLRPENEIQIWEHASLITALYRANRLDCTNEEANEVLFLFLMGDRERQLKLLKDQEYRELQEKETGVDYMLAFHIRHSIMQHPDVGEDPFTNNESVFDPMSRRGEKSES